MRKPVMFLSGVLLAALGWIFFKNYTVALGDLKNIRVQAKPPDPASDQPNANRFDQITSRVKRFLRTDGKADRSSKPTDSSVDLSGQRVIRVATFNIDAFNDLKARKPQVIDILARVGRRFDVIAVQGIQSEADDIVPRLVELMNKTGQQFDFAIGPRLGPVGAQHQYAFVFNPRSVVIDRSELYTVDDQDDLMLREPFVGWFRTVGPEPSEAFTFSLVNVCIDPSNVQSELSLLDDVLFAVQDDGRDEDDVILAGDFQAGARELGDVDRIPDVTYAVRDVPTNAEGTKAWSNIVVRKSATIEFNGRGGVFDFLREYNLNLDEALEVSNHLPVWAEFSIYEGGQPGRVAQR